MLDSFVTHLQVEDPTVNPLRAGIVRIAAGDGNGVYTRDEVTYADKTRTAPNSTFGWDFKEAMDKVASLKAQNPTVDKEIFYTHDEKGCQKILSRFFSNSNIAENIRHSHPVEDEICVHNTKWNSDCSSHYWVFADIPLTDPENYSPHEKTTIPR
jgi:hypothetical protein